MNVKRVNRLRSIKMVEKRVGDTNTDRGPVPLTMLVPGERAKIVALGAGSGKQRHFRTMGLMEGKIVKIIATQPARGPLVIDVEGTQIAIGRGMARQILIQKI
jgi:ferrous iron transport protein A